MSFPKHLLGLRDLSRENIIMILDQAAGMKKIIDDRELRNDSLKNASIITLFYENSTRTKMSFMMAGEYLGAKIDDLGILTSSVSKGESLADTGINLDQMGINIMIIRHQMTGAAHFLAKHVGASVINAGDGSNEHPTQALLDIFTIKDHFGTTDFSGLKVAILGDITNSRVARSNVFGLTKLGAKITLAGPATLLSNGMKALGVEVTANIKEAVSDADVVMGLRIQHERQKTAAFPNIREYANLFGISADIMSYAKKDAIIMHPGPVNRGVEFTPELLDSDRSVIYMQVKNGVAVRMALLNILAAQQNGRRS